MLGVKSAARSFNTKSLRPFMAFTRLHSTIKQNNSGIIENPQADWYISEMKPQKNQPSTNVTNLYETKTSISKDLQFKLQSVIGALREAVGSDATLLETVSAVDISHKCSWTNYMIFVPCRSLSHLKRLSPMIYDQLTISDLTIDGVALKRIKMQGLDSLPKDQSHDGWVLIDCGPVVIHLQTPQSQERYDLKSIWSQQIFQGILVELHNFPTPRLVSVINYLLNHTLSDKNSTVHQPRNIIAKSQIRNSMQQFNPNTATASDMQQRFADFFKVLRSHQAKLTACLDKNTLTLKVSGQLLLQLAHELHQSEQSLDAQLAPLKQAKSKSLERPKKHSIGNWFQSNVINKISPLLPLSQEERFKALLLIYIEDLHRWPSIVDDAIKMNYMAEREAVNFLKMVGQLCSDFRRYIYFVLPPIKSVIARCNEYLMFSSVSRRCHSIGFGFSLIPEIAVEVCRLELAASETRAITDADVGHLQVPAGIKRIQRHPIDERFDYRVLHDDKRRQKDGLDLTEMEVVADGQRLMEYFCKFQTDQRFRGGAIVQNDNNEEDADVACLLTATYPMIRPSRLMPAAERSQRQGEDLPVLLNDPNADAYLLIECENCIIGCIADGMGAGHHARIASNLLCAVILARVTGFKYGDQSHTGTLELNDSGQVLRFLESTIKEAQRVMYEIEECGGTTLVMWVLTKVKSHTDEYTHLLNYVIAGDAEGYHYTSSVQSDTSSSPRSTSASNSHGKSAFIEQHTIAKKHKNLSKKWRTLHQYPLDSEGIRLNTSYTPGAIGKHHGTSSVLWGAFTNTEYVKNNWKIFEASLRPDAQESTSLGSIATLTDFYAHSNNIHFGQVFCEPDDYLIFATDGLGDTLDPLQLYPRPYLIHGLESFSSWEQFQKEFDNAVNFYGSAMVSRDLKEMAINNVLSSTMTPYGLDIDAENAATSLRMAFTPKPTEILIRTQLFEQKSSSHSVSAKQILDKCVAHAMEATSCDRKLYEDDKFLLSSRPEKQKIMEQLIDKYITDKLPFRRHTSVPGGSSLTSRTQHLSVLTSKSGKLVGMSHASSEFVRFGLPHVFVPFAKIDHLGLEVLRVGALD